MNERRFPLEKEEPKHRKKSKKKGQPRADHKHEYETVLLHRNFGSLFDSKTKSYNVSATKVCVICGRVGYRDESRYELVDAENPVPPYHVKDKVIKDKDSLEKWYCDDWFDKFAKRYTP
jgi:hypothetical protein